MLLSFIKLRGAKGRKVRSGYLKRKQRALQTWRLLSEREGRRPGWRQLPRSLLRSLRVPGTAARFSDRSRRPGPGSVPGPPPSAFRCSPYLLWLPPTSAGHGTRLPPAFTACYPGARLAPRPDFGGGTPCPCRGGERHECFGRGRESLTWHCFDTSGRSDVERRDDFSYPAWGSAASPGTIFRGGPELTGTPERSAGGRAVTATRREGRAQRDQRQPISCGGPDPPPNPEAALGRLHAGSGQPLLPTLLSPGDTGRTKICHQGCPVVVMLPPVPSVVVPGMGGLRSLLTPPVAPFF